MNKHPEIHTVEDIKAAIRLLQTEKHYKEILLKNHFKNFKESLKPANILSETYESITGAAPRNKVSGTAVQLFKSGLALWLSKLLFKAEAKVEQRVYAAVDAAFDKMKSFIEKKLDMPQANNNSKSDEIENDVV